MAIVDGGVGKGDNETVVLAVLRSTGATCLVLDGYSDDLTHVNAFSIFKCCCRWRGHVFHSRSLAVTIRYDALSNLIQDIPTTSHTQLNAVHHFTVYPKRMIKSNSMTYTQLHHVSMKTSTSDDPTPTHQQTHCPHVQVRSSKPRAPTAASHKDRNIEDQCCTKKRCRFPNDIPDSPARILSFILYITIANKDPAPAQSNDLFHKSSSAVNSRDLSHSLFSIAAYLLYTANHSLSLTGQRPPLPQQQQPISPQTQIMPPAIRHLPPQWSNSS